MVWFIGEEGEVFVVVGLDLCGGPHLSNETYSPKKEDLGLQLCLSVLSLQLLISFFTVFNLCILLSCYQKIGKFNIGGGRMVLSIAIRT